MRRVRVGRHLTPVVLGLVDTGTTARGFGARHHGSAPFNNSDSRTVPDCSAVAVLHPPPP